MNTENLFSGEPIKTESKVDKIEPAATNDTNDVSPIETKAKQEGSQAKGKISLPEPAETELLYFASQSAIISDRKKILEERKANMEEIKNILSEEQSQSKLKKED